MTRGVGVWRAALLVAALTVVVTWPQAGWLQTRVADHRDPLFSAWRLAWIAHALRTPAAHLYDGNIFFPARGTLTYSDATLLQGMLAAPFLWAGLSPVLVYNLVLLTGIASAGLGMFVLVRHLTSDSCAALVAAACYTLLPYRVEHFVHLEMQWTMFMPLAFWAVHRALEKGSWRFGLVAGLFVWLQFLACMYYGVF